MKKKIAKSKPKTSARQPAKGCRRPSSCSALSVYAAIGDVAARLYHSWSWGRDAESEQLWARMICEAVGVKVRKCPLPHNLQGQPLKWKPNAVALPTASNDAPNT